MFVLAAAVVVAQASDHADSPTTAADPAADLADVYTWLDGDRFVAVLTFAGASPAGAPAAYDADVLYRLHVDTTQDAVSDLALEVRFGQDSEGDWGVQLSGVPGAKPLSGAVETELTDGSVRLWAGLRDDPFFFDDEGLQESLSTGKLAFDNTRDSLAGTNATAIVIEAPASAILGKTALALVWATTARKEG